MFKGNNLQCRLKTELEKMAFAPPERFQVLDSNIKSLQFRKPKPMQHTVGTKYKRHQKVYLF